MNRTTRFLFALWIIAAGSAGSPDPCIADTPVTLHPEVEVHRIAVRLSDIFDGVPAEEDRDIAQAPAPGKQVTYDVNVLTRVAEKYDLDWKPKSIADHVTVTTACARITADMIRQAVAAKVKSTGNTNIRGTIEVAFDNRTTEIDLPSDKMPDFSINNFDYDAVTKRFRGDLIAQTASGPFSFPVSGRITIKHTIPVLAHHLEGGTVVSASDIDQIEVAEDHLNSSVISEPSQLIGHELRRDTDAGEILHAHDIVPPRFVTRGSLVTLTIQTPYMQLTAQGKVLQDGAQGDVVRVINTQSNRTVEGTVEGPGVVRIQVGQKIAEAQ